MQLDQVPEQAAVEVRPYAEEGPDPGALPRGRGVHLPTERRSIVQVSIPESVLFLSYFIFFCYFGITCHISKSIESSALFLVSFSGLDHGLSQRKTEKQKNCLNLG